MWPRRFKDETTEWLLLDFTFSPSVFSSIFALLVLHTPWADSHQTLSITSSHSIISNSIVVDSKRLLLVSIVEVKQLQYNMGMMDGIAHLALQNPRHAPAAIAYPHMHVHSNISEQQWRRRIANLRQGATHNSFDPYGRKHISGCHFELFNATTRRVSTLHKSEPSTI